MDATCKTCPFWGADEADRKDCGERPCQVRSPATYSVQMKTGDVPRDARWPWTGPDCWCGEHPLRQRDRLAAMAMQGMLSRRERHSVPGLVAQRAYEYADTMLAARTKTE